MCLSQYEVQQGKQETASLTLEDSSPPASRIAPGLWVETCGQYDYFCLIASDATNKEADQATGNSHKKTFRP